MSIKTDEILEKLKYITMLEATELVKQIEYYFGVSANKITVVKPIEIVDDDNTNTPEPKTIFDVVLVEFPPNSLIAVMKQVRVLTQWGIREIRDSLYNLPQIIKSNVNIQEAEQIKQKFEELGAIVDLK
ncbi:MAG: 50S ribosomal protein L7/L12 [Okeania sp. SIO3B5]|uniref:50S ribosomal protein L7/L12 n=1 Tax=Okeania sp. SIO3B5 TaxID=2607811 RepID=UPI0013FEC0F7|nr:50S ribosomal protein L7/L12 [Okeania sp. SIO3B5]NEO57046.1 50S ribosomal protein L7/L12 [Okeania sp. SIO3B5]